MKPRLAIVRGHFFSKEETQMFESLTDEFDITFFASTGNRDHSDISFPVVELPCLDKILDSLSFGAFGKIYGLVGNLTGVDPEFVLGLRDRLRGFDVVHTIDYNYLITYQLAKLKDKLGFKLVAVHWDNIPFARDRQPIARHVKYRVYDEVDGFFAMSERAKAALVLEGVDESRVFVTGYPVDTSRFSPNASLRNDWRKRYGIQDDDIVILFAGRVRASKGVFELVYAAKKLVDDPGIDKRKLKIIIAGKGPREEELDARIRYLRLEGNVIRIGFIPHSDMHFLYNMADIFCLPSIPRKYWQEQLGLVFLEAMACKKPVVSTLSGSIPEIVGEAGILVQPNDHIALYEGLRRLIDDPILRASLGEKGYLRCLKRFSMPKISEAMMTNFKSILSRNDI
jgi:glycosyltransferase involved in cell wall biosynthesis